MQELVQCVHEALTEPWHKKVGRPKSCGLDQAVEIACMYLHHNGTQEFLGELRGISQSTASPDCDHTGSHCQIGVGGIRAERSRGDRDGQRQSLPGGRHHHPVLVLRRSRRVMESQARHDRIQRTTDLSAVRRRRLRLRPPFRDAPTTRKHSLPRRSPRSSENLAAESGTKVTSTPTLVPMATCAAGAVAVPIQTASPRQDHRTPLASRSKSDAAATRPDSAGERGILAEQGHR